MIWISDDVFIFLISDFEKMSPGLDEEHQHEGQQLIPVGHPASVEGEASLGGHAHYDYGDYGGVTLAAAARIARHL